MGLREAEVRQRFVVLKVKFGFCMKNYKEKRVKLGLVFDTGIQFKHSL